MKTIGFILTITVGVALLTTSCNNGKSELQKSLDEIAAGLDETKFKKVDIDSLNYTMEVPDKMTPAVALNADASLQYSNPFKNQYVIVINEPIDEITEALKMLGMFDEKKTFMENFVDYKIRFFEENATSVTKGDLKKGSVYGLESYQIQADAMVEGVPQEITYCFGFIEGPKDAYMIMSWTLASDKEKFIPIAEKMFRSFRVKPGA